MSWGRTYGHSPYQPEPRNDPGAILRDPRFGPAVLQAIQDARLRGFLVDKSVGWDAVDLPLVTDLPLRPKDRAEVNYLIDETNEVVVRMVYRQATDNWVQIGKPAYVTSLPSVPSGVDGVEVYYVADDTNGVVWHLRYDSTETTYKWQYVGGPPLYSIVTTQQSRTSSSYGALATAGPSVTLPLAGDYIVEIGAKIQTAPTVAASPSSAIMSYDIGATGAVDGDAINVYATTTAVEANCWRAQRKTGLTAVTLTAKYALKVNAGTGYFQDRTMQVTPVRVI